MSNTTNTPSPKPRPHWSTRLTPAERVLIIAGDAYRASKATS